MRTIGFGLYYLFDILTWVIVIRSFMTWIPNVMESDMGRRVYNFLCNVTDPIEAPIRSIMYKYSSGPVDFSPMIAILLLMFLKRVALMMFY
ncbi:YggT family protein [Romboutsia sp.]|uniref:YggT family protein n=1 Tax=Romboutsia sp. TaxID=1965302 RepID=UPI002CE9672D|nr:YggT family protein [Romboutsia sp.]HSQ89634.1 YggT family protein [Romboutsia sp.]